MSKDNTKIMGTLTELSCVYQRLSTSRAVCDLGSNAKLEFDEVIRLTLSKMKCHLEAIDANS